MKPLRTLSSLLKTSLLPRRKLPPRKPRIRPSRMLKTAQLRLKLRLRHRLPRPQLLPTLLLQLRSERKID